MRIEDPRERRKRSRSSADYKRRRRLGTGVRPAAADHASDARQEAQRVPRLGRLDYAGPIRTPFPRFLSAMSIERSTAATSLADHVRALATRSLPDLFRDEPDRFRRL